MKKGLLLVVLLCVFFAVTSFGQSWEWAKSTSCKNDGVSETECIAYDRVNKCLYTAGLTMADSLCLSSYVIRCSPDSQQLLVVKYDTLGNILWVRTSSSEAWPQKIATDVYGNLYVYGGYSSYSVSFLSTLGSVTISNPYFDFFRVGVNSGSFIVKYDTYGNIKWAKNFVNEYYLGVPTFHMGDIATDANGGIYICATYLDSVIHVGSYVLTNSHYANTTTDILLAKYDSAGNAVWAKSFGGDFNDKGMGLEVGSNNRVYMTGMFSSSKLTFGTTTLTSTGSIKSIPGDNVFLSAFDTNGNNIWTKCSVGNGTAYEMSLDSENNILIGGAVLDTFFVTFGIDTIRNVNLMNSTYIAKFDTGGNNLWINSVYPLRKTTLGRVHLNELHSIAVDKCENIWVAGYMDFDTIGIGLDKSGTIMQPPSGGVPKIWEPMFFIAYSSNGTLVHYSCLKSGGDDGPGLCSDGKGNIYISGDYSGAMKIASDTLYDNGAENLFLAKFKTGDCAKYPLSFPSQILKLDISLYPNPANSECTVTYLGTTYAAANISIYDVTGRLMHTYPLAGSSTTVSIADLLPGIYHCRIDVDGNGAVSKKLVVIR